VNGSPASHSQQFGTTMQTICNTGFIVQGSSSRRCGEDKHWSGSDPQCVSVTCSGLPNVSNGHFDVGHQTKPFHYNQTVTLTCDEGYKHIGTDVQKRCIYTDTWSGNDSTCNQITCGQPTVQSQVVFNDSKSVYDFNTVLVPSCKRGYYIMNNITQLICNDTNVWIGEVPICAIVQCQSPTVPNGTVVSSESIYNFNTSITIECYDGFEIKDGSYTRTCKEDGTWGLLISQCERIRCDDFPDVGHEDVVVFPHLLFGDVGNVSYNATIFYLIRGTTEVMCSSEKKLTWTSAPTFGMINDLYLL